VPERFLPAADKILRGFGLNQAGPTRSVTGFPVGGNKRDRITQELALPVRIPAQVEKSAGAIFYDGKGMFQQIGGHLRSFAQRSLLRPPRNLSYLSHTVGMGICGTNTRWAGTRGLCLSDKFMRNLISSLLRRPPGAVRRRGTLGYRCCRTFNLF